MRLVSYLAVVAGLWVGSVPAQEPTDAERRAEAHRTVLRRLSATGGARTATLAIPADAAAFVDLYLDVHRNKDDIRAGRAPRSRMFMGVPHPVMRIVDEKLDFAACFVNLEIDRVQVALRALPVVVEAAIDKTFVAAVRVASDDEKKLRTFVRLMTAELAAICDTSLDRDGKERCDWERLRVRTVKDLVAGLDEAEAAGHLFGLLNCLKRFGGEAAAAALVVKLESRPTGSEDPAHAMYVRAIAGMRGETARGFLKKVMSGRDDALKAAALSGLSGELDAAAHAMLEGVLAPDAGSSSAVKLAAVAALGRAKSERALAILEKAFLAETADMEKYSIACQLTRMDSPAALPYLQDKLVSLRREGGNPGMVAYLERLLSEYRGRNRRPPK